MNRIDKRSLFTSCVLVEDAIFAFTQCGNLPVKIDLNSKEMRYVDELVGYKPFISEDILSGGKFIYALSQDGQKLLRWDLSNQCCSYFEINCGKKEWGNYAAIAGYEGHIYIFPKYTDELVRVNIETGGLERDKHLYKEITPFLKKEGEFDYFTCGCQQENLVWLFQRQKNTMFRYDMADDTWEEHKLSLKVENCVQIVLYSRNVYMLDSGGRIYFWNTETYFMELLADCHEREAGDAEFGRMAVTDKKIYMLPALGKDIICISPVTKETKAYQSYPEHFQYLAPAVWNKYQGYCEDNDFYYFAMRSANYILVIEKSSGQEDWIRINPPAQPDWFNAYRKYHENPFYKEIDSVEELLKHVCDSGVNTAFGRDSAGERIWKELLKK